MKLHIIPIAVLLLSLSAIAQVGPIDSPQIPQTENTQITPGNISHIPQKNTIDDGYRRNYQQQRMEDSSSLSGGSMGGSSSGAGQTRAPVGLGSGVDSGAGAGVGSGF